MDRSRRWDKFKLVGLSIALSLLAGWALWVTSPKPELTSVAWRTSFDRAYADRLRGEIVAEVSESLTLLHALAALASTDASADAGKGAGASADPGAVDLVGSLLPYRDHEAVSAVSEALRAADPESLAGIFAFEFRDGNLVRSLPHELPAFSRTLEPRLRSLAAFAWESGFREAFAASAAGFRLQLAGLLERVRIDSIRSWLEAEFPAITHDAYRIVASPFDTGPAFSHAFSSDDPAFSEIVVYLGLAGEAHAPRPGAQAEVFAAIARHYVSRMTDRYIRIVNRVFANIAIWSPGDLDREPADIFNDYMTLGSYVLYVQAVDPGAFDEVSERVIDSMESIGYSRFEDFLGRLVDVYGRRRENERLGMLYPRVVREAIRLAREYESI